MIEQHLHVISFNIPYPPDYGGVIDVYYKVKALSEKGIKVHLHCFQYNRQQSIELKDICYKVHYYKRKSFWKSFISIIPYIVHSRKSKQLLINLLKDNYPILFEGIHTCFYLKDKRLKNRIKAVRIHNIENQYYWNLFKMQRNVFKKIYFVLEAIRLRLYQSVLTHAQYLFTISPGDTKKFQKRYNNVIFIPPFHSETSVECLKGKGKYVLYHADLSITENEIVASWLIDKVFNNLDVPLIIAGKNPSRVLKKKVKQQHNVTIQYNLSSTEMNQLIQNAHINLLPILYPSGFKLKLIHALFKGRFCISNSIMLKDTGLEDICVVADTVKEIKLKVNALFQNAFGINEIERRKIILEEKFSNNNNAEKIIELF